MEDSLERIYTVGGRKLEGEVGLSGSKNATLAILAATLIAQKGQSVLKNVPQISDVRIMCEMLEKLGAKTSFEDNVLLLDASSLQVCDAPYDLIKQMRASFSVLGPLVARFGHAKVALPGGCDIGARPVDFHLKGLMQMGAKITVEHGFVEADAPNGLRGAEIFLEFPSVGATTHLMVAAALAHGTTRITNAAEEPDILACAAFINALGGRVSGAGTKTIVIEGRHELRGAEYVVDSDRIEAGTFAAAAAITGGDIYIRGAIESHLEPVTSKLLEAGVIVSFDQGGMRVTAPSTRLKALNIRATPYPGFPTDMQPIFAALLTVADGSSVITETVYERRFKYINELARMGADCRIEGSSAIIIGAERLTGAPVDGSDLRATAALVLAGLAASGRSESSPMSALKFGERTILLRLRLPSLSRSAAARRVPLPLPSRDSALAAYNK
jgi:UDP-N-acetylglucosamine 1-carboxyvinyltransferase